MRYASEQSAHRPGHQGHNKKNVVPNIGSDQLETTTSTVFSVLGLKQEKIPKSSSNCKVNFEILFKFFFEQFRSIFQNQKNLIGIKRQSKPAGFCHQNSSFVSVSTLFIGQSIPSLHGFSFIFVQLKNSKNCFFLFLLPFYLFLFYSNRSKSKYTELKVESIVLSVGFLFFGDFVPYECNFIQGIQGILEIKFMLNFQLKLWKSFFLLRLPEKLTEFLSLDCFFSRQTSTF